MQEMMNQSFSCKWFMGAPTRGHESKWFETEHFTLGPQPFCHKSHESHGCGVLSHLHHAVSKYLYQKGVRLFQFLDLGSGGALSSS